MTIHRLLCAAAVTLCAACSITGSDEAEYDRVPGLLATSIEGESLIEVPESAEAGQAFIVSVTTQGSGCRRIADPEVQVAGLQADVKIWEEYPADGVCTRDLRALEHRVEVRVAQRGTARVRVHGMTYVPIGVAPVVVERTITIR